jgi:hypothetical protein
MPRLWHGAWLVAALALQACGDLEGLIPHAERINGTVLLYHFDETGGSTAVDASGNGFDGTIFGAPRVSGQVGTALEFDNSSNRVEIVALDIDPPYIFENDQISIETWIRPTALDVGTDYFVFGGGEAGSQSFKLIVVDRKLTFQLWNFGWETIIESDTSLDLDTWTDAAVTFDGDEALLYLNGAEDSAVTKPFPIGPAANTLFIGGTDGAGAFAGDIDEVRLSNIVRTPAEIESYYDETK